MLEILGGRLLEAADLHALRVQAAHHVLDGPVLAGGIHRLENQQQRFPVLRVKPVLEGGHALDVVPQLLLGLLFVPQTAGLRGVEGADVELSRPGDGKGSGVHENRHPFAWHSALVCRAGDRIIRYFAVKSATAS